MTTLTKFKIASIVALLGGPGLAFTGLKDKERLEKLEKIGREVTGEIQGGESREGRKSSSYKLDVVYPTNGAPLRQTFQVSKEFYNSVGSGGHVTQPKVKVRFLPDEPATAIVVNGSTDQTAMLPAGIGLAVLGLVGIPLTFFKKWGPKSPPASA
jgi:hypothetical protein